MIEPFTKPELKAVFHDQNVAVSQSVKACLERSAHYRRMYETCKAGADQVRISSDFIDKQLHELQDQRCQWIFMAMDIAQEEKQQGWRFIEDGDKYIAWLLLKYDGDPSQFTKLEQLEYDNAQWLDEMNRRQEKGDWR